jgi:hypothetical protein
MGFYSVLALLIVVFISAVTFIIFNHELILWGSDHKYLVASSGIQGVDNFHLGLIRLLMASVVWYVNIRIITDKEMITLSILLPAEERSIEVHLAGPDRFATFTIWSWTLLGIYLTLASLYSLTSSNPQSFVQQSDTLAYITSILFEISMPMAFLVSYIVTYVIIPSMAKSGLNLNPLYSTTALLSHNANIIFVAIEMILNRVAVNELHFPFIIFYACAYVAFAWVWYRYRGFFFYFFLDYNHPLAVPFHIGLLCVVAIMFSFGYAMFYLKSYNNILSSIVSLFLCRLGSLPEVNHFFS